MTTVTTKSVRMDAETLRRAKVASAKTGESLQAWVSGAVNMRLEREQESVRMGDRRVASVTFEEEP